MLLYLEPVVINGLGLYQAVYKENMVWFVSFHVCPPQIPVKRFPFSNWGGKSVASIQ